MATDEEQLVLSISADTRQILRAMKRLEGDIAKSSAGIEKKFASVGKAIDKAMPTAIQERINRMVGAQSEATKEWTGLLAEQGKEMERLRARFNPMFSTVTRYKSAIGEIRAAHRLGAISADEMTAAIQRERQAALASIAAIKGRNAALADTPAAMGLGKGANSFNTANIAAQFQDIAVMAQMGIANPLTIALQQGTQLSAVFNQMGGTRDVIRGIGSAFLSIVNPVSLVTVGTIAAGVAAYNYFSSVDEGSADTKEALKEQEALIQRVAQAWGDVLPAIRAVAAERDRLAGRQDVTDAFDERYKATFKEIGQEIASAGDQVTELMDQLRNLAPPNQLVAWQAAFRSVTASAAENKTTVDELAEERAQLGLSFEAQQKRRTAFELEQKALRDVREEARRKGEQDWQNAQLTPEQIRQIDEVSAAYARQAEELRKAQNELSFQKDMLRSALGDLRSALDDGKLEWEEMGQIAINVLDKITDKLLNDVLDAIFQVNGAGGGGGLLGFLGSLIGLGGGGRGLNYFPPAPTGPLPFLSAPSIATPVAPAFSRPSLQQPSGAKNVNFNINVEGANGDQHVIDLVTQGVTTGLREFSRGAGRDMVKAVVNDPRAVG